MIPEVLAILAAIVGAVVGYFGNYLIERRRERIEKTHSVKSVECLEIVNTMVLDKQQLGPIGGEIQIKVREAGPQSDMVDVDALYFARYRLRNLSDYPIGEFSIAARNTPRKVKFSLSPPEDHDDPEWQRQFRALLQERMVSESRGWTEYPVPYLNPHSSTGHEIFLELSSYESLAQVQISGGTNGIKFLFIKLDALN